MQKAYRKPTELRNKMALFMVGAMLSVVNCHNRLALFRFGTAHVAISIASKTARNLDTRKKASKRQFID